MCGNSPNTALVPPTINSLAWFGQSKTSTVETCELMDSGTADTVCVTSFEYSAHSEDKC